MIVNRILPRTPAGLRLNGAGKALRRGFTITELMVAMALIMLIMAIMADAFTAGLKTFSDLKAIGDMDQKLRAAVVILSRDLTDDHFGTNGTGSPWKLSQVGLPVAAPAQGFFAISTGTSTNEGSDADGIPSYRGNSILHFTVNRAFSWNPNLTHLTRRDNYFVGNAPAIANMSRFQDGQNYYSQVAEVAYFLQPTSDTTTSGLTRYTLYRRQAVVLTDNDVTTMGAATGNMGSYYDVSWRNPPTGGQFNKFGDLTSQANRYLFANGTYSPLPIYGNRGEPAALQGADILLTDVLSFCVQVLPKPTTGQPAAGADFIDQSFDTATATTSISAIQIIIRVWDPKTQAARQITIVQDM